MVMQAYRAIDLIVYPFTPETKAGPYEHTSWLKGSLTHIGVWDKEFTAAELVVDMDAAGVEKALIPAQAGGSWEVSYEYIRDMTSQFPGRLYGMAGIDPRGIASGVRKLELAVREYGFVGAHSYPHWFKLSPDDRSYYPFYAKCVELDVPVQIQVGFAWQTGLRNVAHPSAIDTIAVDFPDLRIVGIHTGYPWEREMISVAWKHPNVYIGADCHPPSSWSPDLVAFIRGGGPKGQGDGGRSKVIWGTNKPDQELAESLADVDTLGFDEEIKGRLIYKNIQQVYRLG